MPHAIVLIWHTLSLPFGDLVVMGALTILAMSVQSWASGAVVLTVTFSWVLIKLTPALETTILRLGGAVIDLFVKYHREIAAIDAKADHAVATADKATSAIVDVRRMALEETQRAKAELLEKTERATAEAIEKADLVAREAKVKRHDLADRVDGVISNVKADVFEVRQEVVEAREELARLKAETARIKVKQKATDSSHALAINTLGQDVAGIVGAMDPQPVIPPVPHVEPQSGDSTVEPSPPNLGNNHNGATP